MSGALTTRSRGTVSDVESVHSIEAKTARLAAAKERQKMLQRHGAAANILLHLHARCVCRLCHAFQTWCRTPALTDQRGALIACTHTRSTLMAPEPVLWRQLLPSACQAEVTALRAELQAEKRARASEEARAAVERRLLVREVEADAARQIDHLEKNSQSALVRHLYEKQEMKAKHHKALQQAEFDKLDMLAQQEARARVREGQLFGHVLHQVHVLKGQLSERSERSEERLRLVNERNDAGGRLEQLQTASGEGVCAPSPAFSVPSAPAPEHSRSAALFCSGVQGREEKALITVADYRHGGCQPGANATSPISPLLATPLSTPLASTKLHSELYGDHTNCLTPQRTAAATAEVAALRERLTETEMRLTQQRQDHAAEISECDQQSSRLRSALASLEDRLSHTEAALRAAREIAMTAEVARSRAQIERAEAARMASDLRAALEDSDVRDCARAAPATLQTLGNSKSDVAATIASATVHADVAQSSQQGDAPVSARPPSVRVAHAPRADSRGDTAADNPTVEENLEAVCASEVSVKQDGARGADGPVAVRASRAASVTAVSGGAVASGNCGSSSSCRWPSSKLNVGGDSSGSSFAALEVELEEDLLLSQRALDFLAELPGTAPTTPKGVHTPAPPSPLVGRLADGASTVDSTHSSASAAAATMMYAASPTLGSTHGSVAGAPASRRTSGGTATSLPDLGYACTDTRGCA